MDREGEGQLAAEVILPPQSEVTACGVADRAALALFRAAARHGCLGARGRAMKRASLVALVVFGAGCSLSQADAPVLVDGGAVDAATDAQASDASTASDWTLSFDPAASAGKVNPALLGHYDLSGALFHYDQVAGLAEKAT